MNTKIILTSSVVFLGILGFVFTFIPQESAVYLDIETSDSFIVLLQLLGALYFSMAIMNWMARGSIIGGIYNKPIAMSNFCHFLIGGLALIKWFPDFNQDNALFIIIGICYLLFAFLFWRIAFQHPKIASHSKDQ